MLHLRRGGTPIKKGVTASKKVGTTIKKGSTYIRSLEKCEPEQALIWQAPPYWL